MSNLSLRMPELTRTMYFDYNEDRYSMTEYYNWYDEALEYTYSPLPESNYDWVDELWEMQDKEEYAWTDSLLESMYVKVEEEDCDEKNWETFGNNQ